jgi:hypothetical protein
MAHSASVSDENGISSPSALNEDELSKLLRGALKLETSTSTPIVYAGDEFSIYVVIRNPFSVPITIYNTLTHIPAELIDQNQKKIDRQEARQEYLLDMKRAEEFFEKLSIWVNYWSWRLKETLRPDPGPRIAVAAKTEPPEDAEHTGLLSYIGKDLTLESGDFIGRDKWDLDFGDLDPEEVRQILWDINEYMRGRQPEVLRPGNSVVRHFILRTKRWLIFTPIAHTFQIQVQYEVENHVNVDTTPFSLNIQASITSSMIGAAIGSILGSLVSVNLSGVDTAELFRALLASIIFAIVIVVAFARKSNVQQIVSVEDFWGGIFIGFLVGYAGESFVTSVIGDFQ